MSFIWPVMLLSLLVVPVFALFYVLLQRRRRNIAVSYTSLGLHQATLGRQLGKRRHLPPALFLIGLTTLMFALARPQAVVSMPVREGIIILAFDVSGSMAADDLKPTRMEAAKQAARDFVQRQSSSIQVGIVAFSDSGFVVQPPTNDPGAIFATINRLSPQRGTSIAEGIFASLNVIAGKPVQAIGSDNNTETAPAPQVSHENAVILLLTDGENNIPPDPFEAAQTAADLNVRIYSVGIGSAAGSILNIDGFNILTQLDEAALQGIAKLTGGAYYNAQNEEDLRSIYENLVPHLVIKDENIEVTSLLAGASLLILLVGGVFSFMWFNRLP